MDLGIRNRVALVTGASSGLGQAVALALAQEGATVAVAARRLDRLKAVADEAKRRGARDARAFAVDLDDEASTSALVARVHETFGSVDILILNGGGPNAGTYTQLTLEDWDHAYRSLLRNMLTLVNDTLPGMRGNKWGRIVALTSSSVRQPIPNLALSNALRVALVSALKTLSSEVAPDGVTVNSIATGRVMTDRLLHLYPSDAEVRAEVPIGRIATPEEFAQMVAFLCGNPASYVTGQTISIDGGLIKSLF